MINTYIKYKNSGKQNDAIDMYFNLIRLGYIKPEREDSLLDIIEAYIEGNPKHLSYESISIAV